MHQRESSVLCLATSARVRIWAGIVRWRGRKGISVGKERKREGEELADGPLK
jgi:hypothetical protein